MSKHRTVSQIAAIALAAFFPIAGGVAQTPAPQQPAAAAADGAQRAQIRQGVPAGDYNTSGRAAADEALPNSYARDETFFKFPAGRKLGSTSAIDIDKDGKSIWIIERCGGQDYCFGPNSHVPPIMK